MVVDPRGASPAPWDSPDKDGSNTAASGLEGGPGPTGASGNPGDNRDLSLTVGERTLLALAPPAGSASRTEGAGRAAAAGSDPPSSTSEGPRKVFSLEESFEVEGRLEKPDAYYILRRSSLDYDWARLDAEFVPLVLESVQDPLF